MRCHGPSSATPLPRGGYTPRIIAATAAATALACGVAGCSSPAPTTTVEVPTVEVPLTGVLTAITPLVLTGVVNREVSPGPAVRLTDANGRPMVAERVRFRVGAGNGWIRTYEAETDVDGIARTAWTLGMRSGLNTLTASYPKVGEMVFSAHAGAGPPASLRALSFRLATSPPGAEAGHLSVLVRDSFGNPAAGVSVAFSVLSGGGSMEAALAITGEDGVATSGRWLVGPAGNDVAAAHVTGLPGVTFTSPLPMISGTIYELDPVAIRWNMVHRLPGRLILGGSGDFVALVDGIVGRGVYTMSGTSIVLRYSDSFLHALEYFLHYLPGLPDVPENAQETGRVSGDAIIMTRCFTEDCYESFWTYRRAATP